MRVNTKEKYMKKKWKSLEKRGIYKAKNRDEQKKRLKESHNAN